MYDLLYFLLVIVFFLVQLKVTQWEVISTLGFKGATPVLFIKRPLPYYISVILLLAVVAALSFTTKIIPWYAGLIILFLTQHTAVLLGRRFAFKNFRDLHKYLIKNANKRETPYSQEEFNDLLNGSRLSHNELIERLNVVKKYSS